LGAATGKGRQAAKSELEKLDLPNISAKDAVKAAAKIIYAAHDDSKDKDFELEISWASTSETKGVHEFVPKELLEEAERLAKEEDEDEEMEED
jgi:20S proteasome subunit alpha 7